MEATSPKADAEEQKVKLLQAILTGISDSVAKRYEFLSIC
jgi:hypothetical protein